MSFGNVIRKIREGRGMSQEDLALKLNVTRQTVSKWELEQTTPEMDKLIEISKIFKERITVYSKRLYKL